MRTRTVVFVIAAVVVTVFAVGIWTTDGRVELGWLRFFSLAVAVGVGVLGLWEHRLWRAPQCQALPSVPRNLRGTWKGSLISFWTDPETEQSPEAKPVYLVVRQTATTVTVVLLTDESRSVSSTATVIDDKGTVTLAFMYVNRPDSRFEHRSRMHHGSAALDVTGRPAIRLRGRYWTDRDSKGELDFGERDVRIADDYDQAAKFFM